PVTIGDYRFERHAADESEGGLDQYRYIGDAVSFGGPKGRAKGVGASILDAIGFQPDDIKSDDQRYSWTLLANMLNQDGPIKQEFSYPWIYSPGTKDGDDSGEYNVLMGHAMNEKFH